MATIHDTLAARMEDGSSVASAARVNGGSAREHAAYLAVCGVMEDEHAVHDRLREYRAEWSRCMTVGRRADALAIGDAILLLEAAYALATM